MGAEQSALTSQSREEEARKLQESRQKYIIEMFNSGEINRAFRDEKNGNKSTGSARKEDSSLIGTDDVDNDVTSDEERSRSEKEAQKAEAASRLKSKEDYKQNDQREIPLDRCGETQDEYVDEVDFKAVKVEPNDYQFQFENLVFEGGGAKGVAYSGAVRRGYNAMRAFLQYYVVQHPDKVQRKKGDPQQSQTAQQGGDGDESSRLLADGQQQE